MLQPDKILFNRKHHKQQQQLKHPPASAEERSGATLASHI
jgi:hypothetical protein